MPLQIIFFGSDLFAVEPLERILATHHRVMCVVGRPDRPSGRGRRLTPTPLVERSLELGIELQRPERLDHALEEKLPLEEFDIGVVVAYGELVPAWLIDKAPCGFVNLHPSLLPRYRGAAPVERAIMEGASITGITTIEMSEKLDAGDIIKHREVPLDGDETAGNLSRELSHVGAALLVETLDAMEDGSARRVPQDEANATYAPAISAEEGNIDWSAPAEKVDRLVRALDPSPGAYTHFRGTRLKILKVRLTDVPTEDEPGTIMAMGKEGFLVNTSSGCVQVLSVKPAGKKKMSSGEFSRGQRISIGEKFTGEP